MGWHLFWTLVGKRSLHRHMFTQCNTSTKCTEDNTLVSPHLFKTEGQYPIAERVKHHHVHPVRPLSAQHADGLQAWKGVQANSC